LHDEIARKLSSNDVNQLDFFKPNYGGKKMQDTMIDADKSNFDISIRDEKPGWR
jgi:hypothetical protein